MSDPRCRIVIPARLASTRLPEKLLRRVAGKSILHHTFLAARRSTIASSIVIAVDDRRLADEVESFGGQWIMTDVNCPSGTDRIAAVAQADDSSSHDHDIFINVQGDEPEIDPAAIDQVAALLIDDPDADMATAGTPIRDAVKLDSASCVKIVMANFDPPNRRGRAVYFSRAAVPHDRDGDLEKTLASEPPLHWHHLGLYAYRREFLTWFADQPPSRLEQTEKLEQLRAIEAGRRILVTRVETATPGIDTEADLRAFAERVNHAENLHRVDDPAE